MKTLAMVVAVALLVGACASPKVINGTLVQPIGMANEVVSDSSNIVGINPPVPCVTYGIVWGNVAWAVVFSETVVAPIYFVGFSIFEPLAAKPNCTK